MLLTEKQAREKWCPAIRYARPHFKDDGKKYYAPAINAWQALDDQARVPDIARCIASDCAMWRWGESTRTQPMKDDTTKNVTRGYCGLGGKP